MSRIPRFEVVHMDDLPGTPCPCGTSRRAFVDSAGGEASFHIVDIAEDSRTHYHRRQTEIYHVLEGEGAVELDGERVGVRPGSTIIIRPECRHRAVGQLRIINVSIPAFDPADEWFDEPA